MYANSFGEVTIKLEMKRNISEMLKKITAREKTWAAELAQNPLFFPPTLLTDLVSIA